MEAHLDVLQKTTHIPLIATVDYGGMVSEYSAILIYFFYLLFFIDGKITVELLERIVRSSMQTRLLWLLGYQSLL